MEQGSALPCMLAPTSTSCTSCQAVHRGRRIALYSDTGTPCCANSLRGRAAGARGAPSWRPSPRRPGAAWRTWSRRARLVRQAARAEGRVATQDVHHVVLARVAAQRGRRRLVQIAAGDGVQQAPWAPGASWTSTPARSARCPAAPAPPARPRSVGYVSTNRMHKWRVDAGTPCLKAALLSPDWFMHCLPTAACMNEHGRRHLSCPTRATPATAPLQLTSTGMGTHPSATATVGGQRGGRQHIARHNGHHRLGVVLRKALQCLRARHIYFSI